MNVGMSAANGQCPIIQTLDRRGRLGAAALQLYYAGRAQAARGQGVYYYLPKLERPEEARWYRDLFKLSQSSLPGLRDAVIRGVVLVESLPCVYYMEEMLHALGEYSAGLNAARWDLKASIFEYVMADPKQVWPDRFGVDIKTTQLLGDIFRRLVAICLKHGAVPIGGMATALPSNDPEVNRVAGESMKADKKWEAEQGFLRAWVAHIFHMKVAGDPFKELLSSGWKPSPAQADPAKWPVRLEVPKGPITVEGPTGQKTVFAGGNLRTRGPRLVSAHPSHAAAIVAGASQTTPSIPRCGTGQGQPQCRHAAFSGGTSRTIVVAYAAAYLTPPLPQSSSAEAGCWPSRTRRSVATPTRRIYRTRDSTGGPVPLPHDYAPRYHPADRARRHCEYRLRVVRVLPRAPRDR